MSKKKTFDKQALKRFLYWITERESIRLKRLKGLKKPWTKSHILRTYRFCNVRRMDDVVSQWLLKNWYEPYFDHPNMLLACAIGRHFNLPEALEDLGFPEKWTPKKFAEILTKRAKAGKKNYNAAYVICASKDYPVKHDMILQQTMVEIRKNPIQEFDTLQESVEHLITLPNLGTFMAGQIVCDLRHAVSGAWSDAATYAPMGPGSKRGMNRLIGVDKNSKLNQEEFSHKLKLLIKKCGNLLPESIIERLEAIDYQNCLCEFDKYERTRLEEGRPKRKYQGV